jgi:hypothetical protein
MAAVPERLLDVRVRQARSYHFRLKPCQSVDVRSSPLKLNTTTIDDRQEQEDVDQPRLEAEASLDQPARPSGCGTRRAASPTRSGSAPARASAVTGRSRHGTAGRGS